MFETMREYQGVGLAAPQVHESVRIFVAGFAPSPDDDEDDEDADRRVPLMALINPEITPVAGDPVEDREGCLRGSSPDRCPGRRRRPSPARASAATWQRARAPRRARCRGEHEDERHPDAAGLRDRVRGAHHVVDDPGLAPDLGHDPAALDGHDRGEPGHGDRAKEPGRLRDVALTPPDDPEPEPRGRSGACRSRPSCRTPSAASC